MANKRSVIATEHIVHVYRRGRKQVEVLPGDIVTAQARETAARLDIQLHDGAIEKPVAIRTNGATAMRRVLYRRHPGWEPPRPQIMRRARKISRLALVGVGGVGTNIAHLAVNCEIADEIMLIDVMPDVAEAVALDLSHTCGVTRSHTRVTGGASIQRVADAEVVVVSAGRPRTSGMSRADLLVMNGRVIRGIGESIANLAPRAIVIVVSNPLDEMTFQMLQASGFARQRVLGMAGTLDSSRFRYVLARVAGVSVANVQAVTLGSHGDEMVPITSKATICGRTIDTFLNAQQIELCRRETVNAGAQVVALKKTGSATLAPAHACLELINHIRGARTGMVPASVFLQGEYGIENTVVGVPCILGSSGVVEIVQLTLSDAELLALRQAAGAVKARLEAA